MIASCVILILWAKKSKLKREKKITKIIITSFVAMWILGMFDSILIPYILIISKPALTPIIVVILIVSIFYSMIKYRFLSISPEMAVNDIISTIDEVVILLDLNFIINTANKKFEEIFNVKFKEMKNKRLWDIILERKRIEEQSEILKNSNISNFSAKIHFLIAENKIIFMDIKITEIKDRFNDLIGYLIIGRQIKELKPFLDKFKITERESDIIFLLISGSTRKEIADKLFISENTVRTHITNIFNKLCVSNRMEMFYVLKEYNLVPEKESDKILFFGTKFN